MSKVLVIVGLDEEQIAGLIAAAGFRLQTPQEIGASWQLIHSKGDDKAELVWTVLNEDQGA